MERKLSRECVFEWHKRFSEGRDSVKYDEHAGHPRYPTTFGDDDDNDLLLTSHCLATRGLLATDHVILNHGQVTRTTPELAPPSPNYHTTPTGGHRLRSEP
ncbi:hypothetical protein TNCV_690731 [Trichonephila clavipes]|nr:hypothetical protein TNCV_690731 [Trichonephila clavipes]